MSNVLFSLLRKKNPSSVSEKVFEKREWGSKKSDKTGQPSSQVLVGPSGSLIQGPTVLSSFSVGE